MVNPIKTKSWKSEKTIASRIILHSFIQTIYVAPFKVHYYSEALTTQQEYCVGI